MPTGIYIYKNNRGGWKLSDITKKRIGQASKMRTPWNKGKSNVQVYTEERNLKISRANKGKTFSEEHKKNISLSQLIINPKYGAIHHWLRTNFGKPDECENLYCENKSQTYDYALIKGKQYERIRELFIKLCRSCHIRYDRHNLKIKVKQYAR